MSFVNYLGQLKIELENRKFSDTTLVIGGKIAISYGIDYKKFKELIDKEVICFEPISEGTYTLWWIDYRFIVARHNKMVFVSEYFRECFAMRYWSENKNVRLK